MTKTSINTSWFGRGAWGIVVLLVGLLLGSCGPAGPGGGTQGDGNAQGETPGDGNEPNTPVLKTLPAECLVVEATLATDDAPTDGEIRNYIPLDRNYDPTTNECSFPGTAIAIPDTIVKGITRYTITEIAQYAFDGYYAPDDRKLTSVTIPAKVTGIGLAAFRYNGLTSVTIPAKVTTIGQSAFANNQLTSVIIPDEVTTIGQSAFRDNKLTSVDLPDSLTTIGFHAFRENKLTSVTLPQDLITIGDFAFYINELDSVTIPDEVTGIGGYAFARNPNLTNVTIKGRAASSVLTIRYSSFPTGAVTPGSANSLEAAYNLLSDKTIDATFTWNDAIDPPKWEKQP